MPKNENELINIEIILVDSGKYKKLMPTQLKHIPHKGDYYAVYADKKVYEIKSVIYEDIQIILVVAETATEFSNIISLVYDGNS